MTELKHIALVALVATGLSGCSSTSDLRLQISAAEERLKIAEAEIAEGTQEIGMPGKDIRTHLSYKSFQQWASSFGQKKLTFRQTSKSGDLARQSRRCVVFPPQYRPGYRVAIHERDSTKIDYTIGPLSLMPDDDGLVLESKMDVRARTQIAGSVRPACFGGWTPTATLGVSGRSRPTTRLRLEFDEAGGAANPKYSLSIISPKKIDVELRTGFQLPRGVDVDVRTTVAIDNVTGRLASGELDLLIDESGEITMPDGSVRNYTLQTVEPSLSSDAQGISFESDIELAKHPLAE